MPLSCGGEIDSIIRKANYLEIDKNHLSKTFSTV